MSNVHVRNIAFSDDSENSYSKQIDLVRIRWLGDVLHMETAPLSYHALLSLSRTAEDIVQYLFRGKTA